MLLRRPGLGSDSLLWSLLLAQLGRMSSLLNNLRLEPIKNEQPLLAGLIGPLILFEFPDEWILIR